RRLRGWRVRRRAAHRARSVERDDRLHRLRSRRPLPVHRRVSGVTPILAFDIETVPDAAGLRRAHAVGDEVSDAAVVEWMAQKRRAQSGSDFLQLPYQKVVAIACALRDDSGFKIASVGTKEDPEPELIRRFFDLIDKHTPQL